MEAKKSPMKCSKCGKPTKVDPVEFEGAKVFHAECVKLNHFSQEECDAMNAEKEKMLKECKK